MQTDPDNTIDTPQSPITVPQQEPYVGHTIQPLSSEDDIRKAADSNPSSTSNLNISNTNQPSQIPSAQSTSYDNTSQIPPQNAQSYNPTNPTLNSNPAAAYTNQLDSTIIAEKKSSKMKFVIIFAIIAILGLASYFGYPYLFPNKQTVVVTAADQNSPVTNSNQSIKTSFITPNINYSTYDKTQIQHCLNTMEVADFEVSCGLVKVQTINNAEVNITFRSGKLADSHKPYLIDQMNKCDITGLSKVNRAVADSTTLDQPQTTACQKLLTPGGITAYFSSITKDTASIIAGQDYYFIKNNNNIVTLQILAGVPFKETNKTITAGTLSQVQQGVLGFIDSINN